MRRKLIIMLTTALFLTGLSFVEQVCVRRMTDDVLMQIQSVMQHIRREEFDAAIQQATEMDRAWDKNARVLEMMVDHGSTDDVRYAFSRLIAALEERDSATAMVYASELEGAIEHVYERQAVTIENIL